jgi:hypothetical protein
VISDVSDEAKVAFPSVCELWQIKAKWHIFLSLWILSLHDGFVQLDYNINYIGGKVFTVTRKSNQLNLHTVHSIFSTSGAIFLDFPLLLHHNLRNLSLQLRNDRNGTSIHSKKIEYGQKNNPKQKNKIKIQTKPVIRYVKYHSFYFF